MTRSQHPTPRTSIRRRRTGCLTCRERRVRCGEEKPDCKNCSLKSRTCIWARDGDQFLQHLPNAGTRPKRFQGDTTLHRDEARDGNKTGGVPDLQPRQNSSPPARLGNLFDQFPTPALSVISPTVGYKGENHDVWHLSSESSSQDRRSTSWRPSISSDDLSTEELACWRSEVFQAYNEDLASSQSTLASSICRSQSARLKDSIDLEHESPIPPNLEPNAELFSDWATLNASATVVSALSGDRELRLLQIYLRECSPWFDASDGQRYYGRKCVDRMMTCPPWRAAALAVSAKHIELHQKSDKDPEPLSLHLYQLAVQLAIDSISGRFDCVGTTAGCVILAVYEMMTVTYQDWRRHLRGCTSIYSHNHWNGDSLGLIGASFWNYARIDIWAAFCVGTETMLPAEQWFSQPDKVLKSINLDEDRHAHCATWLLARVNNLIHSPVTSEVSSDNETCLRLRKDLTTWSRQGTANTKPIMRRTAEASADRPFPLVLFSNSSSTIAHLMWHTAMILLLDFESTHTKTMVPNSRELESLSQTIYDHACTACGIIETSDYSSAVQVNAVQPLWICGRHLRTRSEKFAVLELLARIERDTGWKTRWRSDGLRELWNLD